MKIRNLAILLIVSVFFTSSAIGLDYSAKYTKKEEIKYNYSLYRRPEDNRQFLTISNNLDNRVVIYQVKKELFIEKMQFIDNKTAILQGFNFNNNSMDVLLFNFTNLKFTPVASTPKTEIIKSIDTENRTFSITEVADGGKNLKYLFNTYYSINNYPQFTSFSLNNDFGGVLSWSVSNRIESLIKLYEITYDQNLKWQINQGIEKTLQTVNSTYQIEDPLNPNYLWASKKFSADKQTPITFMVNNAKIMYPLMLAYNRNLIEDPSTKVKVLETAQRMYAFYEQYYNPEESMYHFPKGINYWADGIWVPFNQQNTFGLVILELYKATADEKYLARSTELAKKFKSELIYNKDGRLLWHYWPKAYYKGWTKEANLSINTPQRGPIKDNLYEDTSHAGINVKFMLEIDQVVSEKIFNDKDRVYLNNTLNFVIRGNKYSRFISGDIKYQKPDYNFIPKYGWVELDHQKLNKFFLNITPSNFPYFLNTDEGITCYLYAINLGEINQESVYINKITYDFAGKPIEKSISQFTLANLKESLN